MEERKLIHAGGPLNACVYLVGDADGRPSAEKDFSGCSRIVRNTLGRFLVRRECRFLRRLAQTGAVPGGVRRTGPFSLREDFAAGETLREAVRAARAGTAPDFPPRVFFERLEDAVRRVHAAGVVHLDLHNGRNVVVGPDGAPVLLDWQSALPTSWMPRPLRRALERIDLAGVFKFWNKCRPGELDEGRLRILSRTLSLRRRFWLPRIRRRAARR